MDADWCFCGKRTVGIVPLPIPFCPLRNGQHSEPLPLQPSGTSFPYCSDGCYKKDLKPLNDTAAFFSDEGTLVISTYDPLLYEPPLRECQHHATWAGRKDREGVAASAGGVIAYHSGDAKESLPVAYGFSKTPSIRLNTPGLMLTYQHTGSPLLCRNIVHTSGHITSPFGKSYLGRKSEDELTQEDDAPANQKKVWARCPCSFALLA